MAAELADPGAVLSLDVRDEQAVERTIARVVERNGRLDILVAVARCSSCRRKNGMQ